MANCSWCNCPEEEHDEYRSCPLLDGKMLCDVCCNYDIMACNPKTEHLEILDVIKRITGKDLTEQEVLETCYRCGQSISIVNLPKLLEATGDD